MDSGRLTTVCLARSGCLSAHIRYTGDVRRNSKKYMRNKLSFSFLKWWHTLLIALVFAIAYIVVDDNNIVSDKVQMIFYIIFWLSVLITIILMIKRKRSS